MPQTRRTGRTEHEIVELPPAALDCGHPIGPGLVTIGIDQPSPNAPRMRTYRCNRCRTVTYVP